MLSLPLSQDLTYEKRDSVQGTARLTETTSSNQQFRMNQYSNGTSEYGIAGFLVQSPAVWRDCTAVHDSVISNFLCVAASIVRNSLDVVMQTTGEASVRCPPVFERGRTEGRAYYPISVSNWELLCYKCPCFHIPTALNMDKILRYIKYCIIADEICVRAWCQWKCTNLKYMYVPLGRQICPCMGVGTGYITAMYSPVC
jgi:hypothetical protein